MRGEEAESAARRWVVRRVPPGNPQARALYRMKVREYAELPREEMRSSMVRRCAAHANCLPNDGVCVVCVNQPPNVPRTMKYI